MAQSIHWSSAPFLMQPVTNLVPSLIFSLTRIIFEPPGAIEAYASGYGCGFFGTHIHTSQGAVGTEEGFFPLATVNFRAEDTADNGVVSHFRPLVMCFKR